MQRTPPLWQKVRNELKSLLMKVKEESEKDLLKLKFKIKGIQIGKEVKPSQFADDMILYIENAKDIIIKLLALTNEYSKVAGYKISTQKSLAFLYTNNEKTEIKKTITFNIVKRIKYLGINLPKETRLIYRKL